MTHTSAWHPIDTAPECCPVLICGGTYTCDQVHSEIATPMPFVSWSVAELDSGEWLTDTYLDHKPKYWQHLPELPCEVEIS